MNTALHGRIFCWQAKRIPSHRMQNIKAFGAPVTGNNIAKRVITNMPHMNPPRRIGKHLKNIIFGFIMVDAGGKTIGLIPFILPFLFNGGGIILGHSKLPSIIFRLFSHCAKCDANLTGCRICDQYYDVRWSIYLLIGGFYGQSPHGQKLIDRFGCRGGA